MCPVAVLNSIFRNEINTVIPPTTPYNPKSVFPNAASTHRLMNSPHTSAYKLRPYVATMFRNIRWLGDILTNLLHVLPDLRGYDRFPFFPSGVAISGTSQSDSSDRSRKRPVLMLSPWSDVK